MPNRVYTRFNSGRQFVAENFIEKPPVVENQYYRKPHDVEIISYDNKIWDYGGNGYRGGKVRNAVLNDPTYNPNKIPMPEVYRMQPDHITILVCHWVKFWRYINWDLSDEKWSTLMGSTLAWMNKTGSPPRKNCVLNSNMTEKDPAFHTPIINGGACVMGTETYVLTQAFSTMMSVMKRATVMRSFIGSRESLATAFTANNTLKITTMLNQNTPPITSSDPEVAKKWVAENPHLWYWGTSVTRTGSINHIVRLGRDGTMKPVRIPMITRYQLSVPLRWWHKLPVGSQIPDSRWLAT